MAHFTQCFFIVGVSASNNANPVDAGQGPEVPQPAQQDSGSRASVRLSGERV